MMSKIRFNGVEIPVEEVRRKLAEHNREKEAKRVNRAKVTNRMGQETLEVITPAGNYGDCFYFRVKGAPTNFFAGVEAYDFSRPDGECICVGRRKLNILIKELQAMQGGHIHLGVDGDRFRHRKSETDTRAS
jgi:hypothetical protein